MKELLESALLRGGPAALSRRRFRDRALVLAYHNVVVDGDAGHGDVSLHLPLERFLRQLEALRTEAEVVPLRTLLELPGGTQQEARRPRVAITFDDAYRGAVTLGLAAVAEFGFPATLFVSPGRLGERSFWWDRYAHEAAREPDVPEFRDTALTTLGGDEARVSSWAEGRGWTGAELPDSYRTADLAELMVAADLPGVTLASHAWSHPNLTQLGDEALDDELIRAREWLTSTDATTLDWLAYPYGIADSRVATAAAAAGYEGALRVAGGWLPRGAPDRFAVPRLNVPAGLSGPGFRLRLAGLGGDG